MIASRAKARGRTSQPLAIGSLTASPCSRGIVLSLSAALSNGTGSGYRYSIYRGVTPDFIVNEFSLLARIDSMPYLDNAVSDGTSYYYGVVGSDDGLGSVTALPAGTELWHGDATPYVTAVARPHALNIVFAGDSITYGLGVRNAGTVKLPTMPGYCITGLRRRLGLGEIYGSNQGHNSHTLTDYAPGGRDYHDAFDRANPKSALNRLRTLHPEARTIVSLMLGTNDSAIAGSNNAPFEGYLTTDQYEAKLDVIIDQLLGLDAPDALIFLHASPYYTANSRTSFVYGPAGLEALTGYREALQNIVARYGTIRPRQVFQGDTKSFEYFAQNYRTEHTAQRYRGSVFYLHPSGEPASSGLIGTQSLGELHAEAIARVVAPMIGQ